MTASVSSNPPIRNRCLSTWLLAVIIGGCISLASLLFVFQHILGLKANLLLMLVLTGSLAPLIRLLLVRYICTRLWLAPARSRLFLVAIAVTAAVTLVLRAPPAVTDDPLERLVSANPVLQRLVQSKTSMQVNLLSSRNPLSSGDTTVLGYIKSQYGDVSFNQVDLEGGWQRTGTSLVASGNEPASLSWSGYPGESLLLVFSGTPDSGVVELVCGGQTQILDLYAAEPREVAAECSYSRQYHPYLQAVFSISIAVIWLFGMMLLFAFLAGKRPTRELARVIVPLFFVIYLMVGLTVYQDYGLSTDEPAQRNHGMVSAKYLVNLVDADFRSGMLGIFPDLETYGSKYYGVAFHLPLAVFEILTDFTEVSQMWLFRHYATFLFFFLGVASFYRLAHEIFGNWRLALLGAAFLVLSPRIFAESFYNVKDTTFLAAFTIALFFATRFWRQPTLFNGILFGLAAAFATNVRIIASLLVPAVILYALLRRALPLRKAWIGAVIAILVYTAGLFLIWPAAWSDPVGAFFRSFNTFSDYTRWDGMIMFRGELIRGQEAPPGFLPIWITITTPAVYLLLFIIGSAVAVTQGMRSSQQIIRNEAGEKLVFLALAILPPLAAILRGSTLYSGWRHFFFIYPSLILIALLGFNFIWSAANRLNRFWERIVLTTLLLLTGGSMLTTGFRMVLHHPFQNVLFTDIVSLFGGGVGFERDYWKLSVRQGLEYVLEHDDRPLISIRVERWMVQQAEILPPEERDRLLLTRKEGESPDYLFRTYRTPWGDYPGEVFHKIIVNRLPILSIYRLQ